MAEYFLSNLKKAPSAGPFPGPHDIRFLPWINMGTLLRLGKGRMAESSTDGAISSNIVMLYDIKSCHFLRCVVD